MSKRLFAIMFAVMIFAVSHASSLRAQASQTIQVDIPFAFTTNNKSLPAGTYRIEPANDSRLVWTIRNGGDRPARFLLATSLVGKAGNDLLVTFHRYSDKYFLVRFQTPSYEIALRPSRREKNLMAGGTKLPTDVINIPTGSAESLSLQSKIKESIK